MKTGRRRFLAAGAAGALASTAARAAAAKEGPPGTLAGDRAYWVSVATRLADPVLTNLARGTLKARMPVEEQPGAGRRPVTHLEALGRLLAGLAPWLELPPDDTAEGRARARLLDLARRAVASAVDPASPDFLNFTKDRQPLVDAAFLAEGLLRAPRALMDGLDATARGHLVRALVSSRVTTPVFSNWLMFTASVEAGLAKLGADWDRTRVDYALRQHEQWYKGDGVYGDGPTFHWDYYNSLVIQPMLLDVLDACGDEMPAWTAMREPVRKRARRHAAVLERLIGPDGSFPPTGRSLAYRGGAFHLLAQVALRRDLTPEVAPAQVRGALTAVLRRTMEAPGTFDAEGWLRIGFCGHQPGVGERYISTGSLYLCAVALLPLGLPADDPFWASPPVPWTSQLAWSGKPFPIDKALSE
jgi:hypothetical protein